jgi:uncharacterized repeat protein (TIGR03837 family)
MESPSSPSIAQSRWDIFCNVVDNFGDIGVCWRLACNLAARGKRVRLWVDDVTPLAWMAPDGHPNVEIIDCTNGIPKDTNLDLGEVLLDTFDCEFAINLIAVKAINTPATDENGTILEPHPSKRPVWLNLEYLTAESFAERAHTLPYSHHSGAAQGWTQRYFYPGFNDKTGGLLREADLFERQKAFDREAWLVDLKVETEGEVSDYSQLKPIKSKLLSSRLISLFCYEPVALESLIDQLSSNETPTCLLVTAGRATTGIKALLEHRKRLQPAYLLPEVLSIVYLPRLTQTDYDHLLWSCDLNFVRGEDSLVRAIWAAKPFIWQIYPQHDDVHLIKLDAFLTMMDAPESLKTAHNVWNSTSSEASFPDLELSIWAHSAQNLSNQLRLQNDLVANLIAFADKNG